MRLFVKDKNASRYRLFAPSGITVEQLRMQYGIDLKLNEPPMHHDQTAEDVGHKALGDNRLK